ncbi:MAG TPA: phosphatase PAP2 family protein [Puia sp.]|nr:phosphatase PAP2 family protein [Puia sp.]
MPQPSTIAIRQEWETAWHMRGFRQRLISAIALVVILLSVFPYFFQRIEQRQGILLNDPLLAYLAPHNVSIPLFILIWSLSTLTAIRAVQNPRILLVFLWSFLLLSIFRTLTILLVPLDPPTGLIGLADPLSNFFYGHDRFVTKDLFFSGHTSSMFLLYFCLTNPRDRKIALIVTFLVAFLLLVQHVHYTLDILGGFLFGWLSWWLGSRIVGRD